MAEPLRVAVVVGVLVAMAVGCGDSADRGRDPVTGGDRWSDIDTSRPSEDPVGTVYGYVQAMATQDDDRACSFQYVGSSDHDPDACVLAHEMPRRDTHFAPDDWEAFAAYGLDAYRPDEDDQGWTVSLPTEPATTWRIVQDDAGIWFVD